MTPHGASALAPVSNPVAVMGLESLLHRIAAPAEVEDLHPTMRLVEFVREAWPILEPDTPLVEGFHVEVICAHLEAISLGYVDPLTGEHRTLRDLLVTIPPRMTKSTIISVCWPAWEWTFRPWERFLTASYIQDVATQDALRTRDLILSPWYQERWGHVFRLRVDENRKTRYQNNRGGTRIAIGAVRGRTTSLGGSRLIVDDPHNVMEAHSFEKRQDVIRWFDVAFSNRQNNPQAGVRVIVQQRVHDHDLAGHVLRQGGWCHLNLPMEYEPTPEARIPTAIGWVDPRTEPGQLLVEERMGREEVEKAKVRMGPADYRAQYGQKPSQEGGNIFHEGYWRWYRADWTPGTEGARPRDEDFARIVGFVDTASGEKASNAYTVFSVWGLRGQQAFLLAVYRDRWAFPRLLRQMAVVWGDWHHRGLTAFHVENKSSGIALIQMAHNPPPGMQRYPVHLWEPGTRANEKVLRAENSTGWLAAGAAVLPATNDGPLTEQLPWVREFVQEHTEFPNGEFADQVDTTTMMVHVWFIDAEEEAERTPVIAAPGGSTGPGLATVALARGRDGRSAPGFRDGEQPYDDDA